MSIDNQDKINKLMSMKSELVKIREKIDKTPLGWELDRYYKIEMALVKGIVLANLALAK